MVCKNRKMTNSPVCIISCIEAISTNSVMEDRGKFVIVSASN